jgi:hypothetical protein
MVASKMRRQILKVLVEVKKFFEECGKGDLFQPAGEAVLCIVTTSFLT